ncbi:MAG TPA: hypothetical protein VNI01_14830, partial [Elusimicrobiota bacterium]|nr:hypothetical protein [Elusimicrobiota bacterium]
MRRKVLIRCDAGPIPEIGTGHLRRCLLIAEQLAARGSEVVFLTASADEVVRTIPYPCRVIPPGDAAGPLSEALAAEKPEIVIWDRLDTGEDVCRAIKAAGAILVTLDDEGPGQRLADVTINAMVAGGDTIYKGPDYAVLPKESAQRPASAPRSARSVFVSFGGYDHGDMTARALEALRALGGGVQVRAAVGAATPLEPLRRFEGPTVRIFQSPPNFGELLREA